jgi:hypothetical protein
MYCTCARVSRNAFHSDSRIVLFITRILSDWFTCNPVSSLRVFCGVECTKYRQREKNAVFFISLF